MLTPCCGGGKGRDWLQCFLDTDRSLRTVPFRAHALHVVLEICLKISDGSTRVSDKKSSREVIQYRKSGHNL